MLGGSFKLVQDSTHKSTTIDGGVNTAGNKGSLATETKGLSEYKSSAFAKILNEKDEGIDESSTSQQLGDIQSVTFVTRKSLTKDNLDREKCLTDLCGGKDKVKKSISPLGAKLKLEDLNLTLIN